MAKGFKPFQKKTTGKAAEKTTADMVKKAKSGKGTLNFVPKKKKKGK